MSHAFPWNILFRQIQLHNLQFLSMFFRQFIYTCKCFSWYLQRIWHSISHEYICSRDIIIIQCVWIQCPRFKNTLVIAHSQTDCTEGKHLLKRACLYFHKNFINFNIMIWVSSILHTSMISVLNLSIIWMSFNKTQHTTSMNKSLLFKWQHSQSLNNKVYLLLISSNTKRCLKTEF